MVVDQYIQNKYTPAIDLGDSMININRYCDTTLSAFKPWFDSYLWQDNSTNDSLVVSETGWYSCTVTDIFGLVSTDSIFVQFPVIGDAPSDTVFCQNDTLTWNTNLNSTNFDFLWSDSSTDSSLNITEPGDYWVRVTDNFGCFQYSDTITIVVDSFPSQASLGPNRTLCQGASLGLSSGNNPVSYLWSTGDSTSQTVVDTAGQYFIQVINVLGCIAFDTVQISLNGIAPTLGFTTQDQCTNSQTIFTDTSFTTDGSNIISHKWRFGDGDTSVVQNPSRSYHRFWLCKYNRFVSANLQPS